MKGENTMISCKDFIPVYSEIFCYLESHFGRQEVAEFVSSPGVVGHQSRRRHKNEWGGVGLKVGGKSTAVAVFRTR